MMKILIVLTLICAVQFGNAQLDTTLSLNEVVVSEKRLSEIPFALAPRNIQVIGRNELQAMPAQSLAEALTWIAGVDLRQRGPQGAQADLSILGSTFEQVLVLIDGIPMRDAQTGHLMMNLPVDIQQIERIEIIKGTAARIYGANALAGAVNFVTRAPASESVYAQLWTGSYTPLENDSVQQYLQAGGRVGVGWKSKAGDQRHQVDVSYFDSEGYRYNSSNAQQRLGYRSTMAFENHKSQLDLTSGIVRNETGANGFYAYPYDLDAYETTETIFASARYRMQLGQWNIKPICYWRYSHDDYIFIREKPEVYRNNHFNTAAGAEVHVSKTNNAGQFGGGYESRAEIIRSNNLGSHNRYYHSFYGEQRLLFENSTVIVIGAMAQYSRSFGLNVYPGLEWSSPVFQSLRAFANVGLGSRNPSFTDLYYSDAGNSGNPFLKPENAFNSEVGFKWNQGKLHLTSSGFVRRVNNFIDFTRANDADLWVPNNFQLVTISGADTRASIQFQANRNVAIENVNVSHTYLNGRLAETNVLSKYALNHLRHQFVGRIGLRFFERYRIQVISRYNERFNRENYWVFDLRASAGLKRVDIALDASNVLNRYYFESGFVPMPGRLLRLSVSWKWDKTA